MTGEAVRRLGGLSLALVMLGSVPAVASVPAAASIPAVVAPPAVVALPAAPAAQTEQAAAAPAAAKGLGMEARYDVALRLAWATGRVRLRTTIDVLNTSGSATEQLLLNTVVASIGSMRGLSVTVDGVPVPARRRGQTIRVPLTETLPEGGEVSVRVTFRARLNRTTGGRDWLWSKAGGVVHMYRFIPWLSRRVPIGPRVHGEPFVTSVSPRVSVALTSDRPLVWAPTGRRVASEGLTKTFVARDVRDFNLAVSPDYRTWRGKSSDGLVDIIVHTRTTDGGRLLRLARQELARFRSITRVTYPYPVYRVAESGAGLAMESPGLIWIPGARSAFDQPFLVSHETAHQWFYALVGNDQATDAFADEALAEYFSRRARGVLRASRCAQDRLDRSIHRYAPGCYYEIIYVQGALFLDKLRRDFGNARFRRAIRAYTKEHFLGMGSNKALLEALRDEMGNRVLQRYRKRFPSLY
ncbi:hypothetical protein BH23CHL8_BH23CHL8_01920 [soil metagenome]